MGYEVVHQTIERWEGTSPYDPQWITVTAPVDKYIVNYYVDYDGPGGTYVGFDRFPAAGQLTTDGSGRVTAVEFQQLIYDGTSDPNEGPHGVDYDVYVICVDG